MNKITIFFNLLVIHNINKGFVVIPDPPYGN